MIYRKQKALTRQSELEPNKYLNSFIYQINSTSKVSWEQQMLIKLKRFKRHIFHQSAYLTYNGGINHD